MRQDPLRVIPRAAGDPAVASQHHPQGDPSYLDEATDTAGPQMFTFAYCSSKRRRLHLLVGPVRDVGTVVRRVQMTPLAFEQLDMALHERGRLGC
jgi:hypothetical protein